MNSPDCLPEPALWPATADDELPAAAAAHLQVCRGCADRVAQLRDQRRQLLAAAGSAGHNECGCPIDAVLPASCASESGLDDDKPEPAARSTELHCPVSIGRYRVERLLKLGGQAEVYLARHPTLDIDVAVKWAHTPLNRRSGIAAQFVEEARLLSRLRHRRLVRVYDLGIADGRPFLVMEYVAGSDLGRTGQRPRDGLAAAALIAKVASALHEVHDCGRLHLDIQPGNILIGRDGEPRLIDFGSSIRRDSPADLRQRTARAGTPEYMAPELLAGDVGRIDVAADVYALGAVLYELLTGAPPQPEILWDRHTVVRGRRPSPRGLGDVPNRLRRVCLRALDPEPARRFDTALEFSRALARSSDRRRTPLLSLLAGLLAALSLIVGLHWRSSYEAPSAPAGAIRLESFAVAVNTLVARATDGRQAACIILADGRPLPVHMEQRAFVESESKPDLIEPLTRELLGLAGTNLLIVVPTGNDSSARPLDERFRLRSSLPTLPPGTVALITNHEIHIVSRAIDGMPTAKSTAALNARLLQLQSDLLRISPQFEALVFAADTSLATRSPS